MKCPSCGYVRKPEDLCPDWQCPSCQIAYNKASQQNIYQPPRMTAQSNAISGQTAHSYGTFKFLVMIAVIGCVGYFGYAIANNPSLKNSAGLSSTDNSELIANKKAELQAYENTLQSIEAEFANARANIGTCPITGQPNQMNITQDPRPELQSKIEKLREEIRQLESKS